MRWSGTWVNLSTYRTLVRMKRGGIVNPLITFQEAHRAGMPVALACALLDQESGGGHNEWGHDPTIFVGGFDRLHGHQWGEQVTAAAYAEYKRQRGPLGRGGMQGVGPCQLTYYSIQDRADALGGCWKVRFNMRVGFADLMSNIHRNGWMAGIAAYNGVGPAAARYAQSVNALYEHWKSVLG